MASYYFVSNLSMPLGRDTIYPYRQVILNAIRFNLDISSSIVVGAINAPKASIERYWKEGRLGETSGYTKGYKKGLPSKILLGRYAFNEYRVKQQLVASHPQLNSVSDIYSFRVKVVRGEDLNPYDVIRAHWSNRIDEFNDDYSQNPIGIVESGAANHPTKMHLGSDGIALKRSKVAEGDSCGTTRWYVPTHNTSSTAPYSYKLKFGRSDFVNDAHGNTSLKCVAGTTAVSASASYFFPEPGDMDWVYVVKWSMDDYPREMIYTLYNKTAKPWLNLDIPYMPTGDHIYPIIQFRRDLEWYGDYLTNSRIKNYERTFNKLNAGTIQRIIDQVSDNTAMNDIDDMFFVLEKDMYSHVNEDMEYVFHHWMNLLNNFGNALLQSNGVYDVNFIGYIEGEFNQHISFRKLDKLTLHATNYYPAKTKWNYVHTWESDAPPGVDDIHLAPWQPHWEQNEHDPGGHYVPLSLPEQVGYEKEFKRMEKVSHHVYVISQYHPDGLLMQRIKIHGLQKHSKLFFDATNQYKWANSIINPDDDNLLMAQYAAEDQKPPVEYTGTQASPFMIPLIHDVVVNDLSHRGMRHVSSTCITLEMYGSKTVYVAWWKEALVFILETLKLAAILIAIATMGTTAMANMAVNTAIEFMYRLGIEVFKQAIVRVILAKGGTELKIVKLIYDIYNGNFGDFGSIADFTMDNFENVLELSKAVIEIAIEVKLEDLKESIANDSLEDLDEEALEGIETAEDLTDIEVNDLVRLNPKFRNVILFEQPQDFIDRTTETSPVDVQTKQLENYGSTPSKSSKYILNEEK